MAITHTGTTITNVENTGTTINSITHTGTQVFTTTIPKTATPSAGVAGCQVENGNNVVRVAVTNNESSSVTIKNYSLTIGTLGPGATASLIISSNVTTPYAWDYSITATATGKSQSDAVNNSGIILGCFIEP